MKKITQLLLMLLAFQFVQAQITNYYVSTTGSNSNNGKSLATAFATIQNAHNIANAGDTINVADGTYEEEIKITKSGTNSKWITYRSINKSGAKITNEFGQGFNIGDIFGTKTADVSYIIIDGFDVKTTATYGNGITSDWGAHHLTIKNCYAHNCGGNGIGLTHGDYLVIENNVCYSNSEKFDSLSGSGITVYGKKAFGGNNNPGFHVIVRGNICYNNTNGPISTKTDGNGIIIDDLRCIQQGVGFHADRGTPRDVNYTGYEVLVENNLCYNNEGAGVAVYSSNNVTVRNNTVYNNEWRRVADVNRGNLSANAVNNIKFINNVSIANSSKRADGGATDFEDFKYNKAISAYGNQNDSNGNSSNFTYYNNITYDINDPTNNSFYNDGIDIKVAGVNGNKCAVNPKLVNPVTNGDFSLQSTSAAINAGTSAYGVAAKDLYGAERVKGGAIDMGAFESDITSNSISIISAPTALNQNGTYNVSVNYTAVQPGKIFVALWDTLYNNIYANAQVSITIGSGTATLPVTLSNVAVASGLHWVVSVQNVSDTVKADAVQDNVRITAMAANKTIQTENFCAKNIITNWPTGIGGFATGGYAKYCSVNLGSGYTVFKMSLATTVPGSFKIRKGSATGTIIGTLNFTSTGGWETYQTKTCSLTGASGTQDIYITYGSSTANVDYFIFSNSTANRSANVTDDFKILPAPITNNGKISIYPNPVINGTINLQLNGFKVQDNVTISILDQQGKIVHQENLKTKSIITIRTPKILIPGMYFIKLQSGFTTISKEFIVGKK